MSAALFALNTADPTRMQENLIPHSAPNIPQNLSLFCSLSLSLSLSAEVYSNEIPRNPARGCGCLGVAVAAAAFEALAVPAAVAAVVSSLLSLSLSLSLSIWAHASSTWNNHQSMVLTEEQRRAAA